jgi:hypothetical protein
MSNDGNQQKIFATLPLKQNDQKNMGTHNRIPSDPAISKHELPNGICRWSLPKLDTHQINEGRHQSDLRLGTRGTLGTAPIIHVNLVAPSPQPGFIHHKQAVALSEHRQHHLHLAKMKRGLLPPATNRRAGVANAKVDGGFT